MVSTTTYSRKFVAAACAAVLPLIGLTACSTDGEGNQAPTETVGEEAFEEAMSTPTKLTFWSWTSDITRQVDLFTAKYPAIEVEVVNVGQGAGQYQKMRTALQAGEGVPDVVQIEYSQIPAFTFDDSLLDLGPYGASDLEDRYADWIQSQISLDDAIYAIPQDTGPMGTLYRSDLLAAAGLELGETWADFGETVCAYREGNPNAYFTGIAPNDAVPFFGLLWQAGARPFGFDGSESVTIDLVSPEVMTVIDYWQDLIDRDCVSTDPQWTDEWYQSLSNGSYGSWIIAAWGPMFLQGTAGSTSGSWTAAPLPQWTAGEQVSGNAGGSANAVMAATRNPIAAAALATFIGSDPESTHALAFEQFAFPADNEILTSTEFQESTSEFFGGQQVNALFAGVAETVSTDFQWLPFMDFVISNYSETLGKEIAERGDLTAGVQAWNDAVVEFATSQGFTVNEG